MRHRGGQNGSHKNRSWSRFQPFLPLSMPRKSDIRLYLVAMLFDPGAPR